MFLEVCLLILLVLTCLIFSVEIYKKLNWKWQLFMQIPGPKPVVFLGNAFNIKTVADDTLKEDFRKKYKWREIFRLHFATVRAIVCFNADDAEYFISGSKITIKSFFHDFMVPWLGTGVFTSSGDLAKRQRKGLIPLFHPSLLPDILKTYNRETEHLVKILHRDCNADYLNVVPYISELTHCAIVETAMRINPRETCMNGKEHHHAISRICQTIGHRMRSPWFYNDYVYMLSPAYWERNKLIKKINKVTDEFMKTEEQNVRLNRTEENDDEECSKSKSRFALIDFLLSDKRKGLIDDEGIREFINKFIFGGHDTTSIALGYSLLLLANYKTVQDEVRAEIYAELGDNTPSYDDLSRLKYMERFIKEVLRLYPSGPFLPRKSITDGTSPSGYFIAKDTLVLISIYQLHRDPDVFPDPEKFDPDRFLPENCKERHPFAYIPFSAGPQNCLGQRLAFVQMKAVLCGILKEFELFPVHKREDMVTTTDFMLSPSKDGIRVKFVPRNKN